VGLAAQLDATFSELERSGQGAAQLANIVTDLKHETDDSSLVKKLDDLRLLYDRYLAFLGQDRLDPHRRLEQVLNGIARCKQICDATVFVDGFLDLQDWQRRMLVALAGVCKQVDFTLLMDPASPLLKDEHQMPDEMGLFYKTEETYRRLWFAFNEAGITPKKPLLLNKIARFESSPLRKIEQLGQPQLRPASSPGTPGEGTGIELIEAPDRRGEVDAAARHVKKLVASGLRFRDIAIYMRDLDDYHELINASFSEHEIPYFVDRRRTAAHHPLLQFTRAILQIALHDWRHDAVMALVKSELARFTRDQADELENYVLLHRIRGSNAWTDAKPWVYGRNLIRGSEDDVLANEQAEIFQLDALRQQMSDRLAPLLGLLRADKPILAHQMVQELFNTFERFGIRASIGKWIEQASQSSHVEQRDEHEQVWNALMGLLDQLMNVIGEESITPEDFVSILETGLEQFDLALTPPTVDQVLVGSIDRTRAGRPSAAVVLGLNDGQFPRTSRENAILSDQERQILRKHRMELGPDSQRNLFDERLLAYLAFTRASSKLCLTRAMADDESRPQTASPYWTAIRRQFTKLPATQIPRENSTLENLGTPRQVVTALMDWVRHDSPAKQPWPALYQWLATYECCSDAVDIMRSRAWRALSYKNEAYLSKEMSEKLFRSPLSASVSQIETFAACPFKHFASYGLGLELREEPDVTAIDLGIVCHSILEKIVRQMVRDHPQWTKPSDQTVRDIAQEVGKDLRGELLLSNARNQYILEHIERTIVQVLEAQAAAGSRGKFVPWRTELQFGDGTKLGALVLETPGGHELRLRGKIDRVDRVQNSAEFAIVDYKYRGSRLALDWVYHGLSLQLLTYLLVLQQNGTQRSNRNFTPVAAFYVQLLRELQAVKHPDDAAEPDGLQSHLAFKPRGMIDLNHKHLLEAEVKSQKPASLYSRPDGCTSEQFADMLRLAEQKLGELTDQILAGQIDPSPYRIGGASPCVNCEFRSVCRFDVAVNRYHYLPTIKKDQVLELAARGRG
ncbi:MAG TPA: PD-(D/E)XK nuclease family protein, partial [Tepidisphaeraceae bacterium]|nr:PD-(D/E)XK nuclease family protein [Tepidisphaeraceae bacterium]